MESENCIRTCGQNDMAEQMAEEMQKNNKKNEVFATIESVKAASEIYMPISGKIVEINEEIVNSPELLNDS